MRRFKRELDCGEKSNFYQLITFVELMDEFNKGLELRFEVKSGMGRMGLGGEVELKEIVLLFVVLEFVVELIVGELLLVVLGEV